MPANSLESWANFFITAAGVSATLAGLVIVAVSVNIQAIMKYPELPPRASATVSTLMLVVAIGLVGLVPQPAAAFAVEVFAFAAIGWTILLVCSREIYVEHLKAGRPIFELAVGLPGWHLAALTFLIGGALLWMAHGAGLYLIAAGAIVTLVCAVMNAWVFLIEILR